MNMQALELKVPPPLVAAIVALLMWCSSYAGPLLASAAAIRLPAALLIAATSLAIDLAGVLSFRRAKTTVNPMKPETTSALVCSGVYRVTRNPMYLGVLFILTAWAMYLSALWGLLGPLAFMLYITRFQIVPEEKILSNLFGKDYLAYQAKVRRWL